MQGVLKRTLHFVIFRLHCLELVIYIAHYQDKVSVISDIHREQHFVKAFSACPAYIVTDMAN